MVIGGWQFVLCKLFILLFSRDSNDDSSDMDDDDDDDGSEGRYDRKQNVRDADDLQQSLRQRLVTSQSVFLLLCSVLRPTMLIFSK